MIVNVLENGITTVEIVQDNLPNTVEILQSPAPNVVEIITAGPMGPVGPYPETGSFATTGSNTFTGNQVISGSLNIAQGISGSFSGSGADLYGIPATAILNLNLAQIVSGSVSASISPNSGLQINTNVTATSFTGSLFGTASYVLGSVHTSANPALSASYALSSSYAATASYSRNLQISGSINNVDYIDFNTTAVVTQPIPGRLSWNDVDGTLDIGLKGSGVTLQIGQEEVARVINKTDSALLEAEYHIVRLRSVAEGGAQGGRLAVVLAQANNDDNSATTLGVVTETIAKNQEGFITLSGQVKKINTTGALQGETWVDGDVLYLSPTIPGHLTNIKPHAPQHMVIVGFVEYAHAINGKIFVKIDNGYEIDELHNVLINTGSLTSGQLLVRSGSVWVNSNQLTGSYAITGSLNVTQGITGSLFGTAATASHAPSYLPLTGGTVAGSLTIQNNLTVLGSASIQYISESVLNIGTNIITVNTLTPSVRFGGLSVIDSGSSPAVSASLLYDSLQDEFIFVHKGTSTSAITSSHFVLGPETYNNVGDEIYLSQNRIPKSVGNEHLNDSNITDSGTVVSINSNTQVTGSLIVTQGISGSFSGSGADLYGIPATAILNLNLAQISSETAVASISEADGFRINKNTTITGSLTIEQSLTRYNLVNASATGDWEIFNQATGSYTSVFVKYAVSNGTNSRAGEFITNWNDSLPVEFTDISTKDIGDTSGIVFTSLLEVLDPSKVVVKVSTNSSGWTIKALATFI